MLNFELSSSAKGDFYFATEKTMDHLIDHLQGLREQLYLQDKPDVRLIEHNLEEILHVFGMNLPKECLTRDLEINVR